MNVSMNLKSINIVYLIVTATLMAGLIGATPGTADGQSSPLQLTSTQQSSGAPGTQVNILGTGFPRYAWDLSVSFVPADGGASTPATVTNPNDPLPLDNLLIMNVPAGLAPGPYHIQIERYSDGATATTTEIFSVIDRGGDSFIETSAGLTNKYARAADWGDYDGDGDLDLVIVGTDGTGRGYQILIYENDGNGKLSDISANLFAPPIGSTKWGDYDNDGDLDLVIIGYDPNYNPKSVIYENNGDGTFSDINAGLTGLDEGTAKWGDFDGDGNLDLVITGRDDNNIPQSIIYKNDESGNFSDIGAGLTGLKGSSADWGDFDGDGDLDLVITGNTGRSPQSLIYENNGDGTFTDISAGLTGLEHSSADWGDYDSDGDLDLIITGTNNSYNLQSLIYKNNGDGSFTDIGAGLTGLQYSSVDWGDFNSDGNLDLAIIGSDDNFNHQSIIYKNDGNGNFSDIGAGLTGLRKGSVDWGDYDKDGDLDLIITGRDSRSYQSLFYKNNNAPGVTNVTYSGVITNGQQLTGSYDYNDGDGDAESGSAYQWYRADDAGGTNQTAISGANTQTYTLTSADAGKYIRFEVIPNDGNTAGTAGQSAFNGSVQPMLQLTGTQQSSGAPGSQVDILGSGFDPSASDHTITFEPAGGGAGTTATPTGLTGDILTTTVPAGLTAGPYRIRVQRASDNATAPTTELFGVVDRGGDSFSDIGAGLTGLSDSSVDWGDYDSDGDLDLVITGRDGSSSFRSLVYENNGDGTFSDISAGLTGLSNNGSADWGDFDGDGDLDLLLTGLDSNNDDQSLIYENNGDGTFSDIGAGLTGLENSSADWGDFDGDGDLDLAITGMDNNLDHHSLVYENNGDGTFSDIGAGLTGLYDGSTNWGDFDRDGDLDLAITGWDNSYTPQSLVYENNGDGTFSDIGAGLTGLYDGSTNWGDFDGDGDLDLAITGYDDSGSDRSLIYENNGGSFSDIGAGLTGLRAGSTDWGDYDGDGDLDLTITGYDDSSPRSLVYENGGNGNFSNISAGLTGLRAGSADWGDFDSDGDLDLAITGYDGSSYRSLVYENNNAPVASDIPAAITVAEGPASPVDLSAGQFSDGDDDPLTVTLTVSGGNFGNPADGSGVGVTVTLADDTTLTLTGLPEDITSYLSTASNITYTGPNGTSGSGVATIKINAHDGAVDNPVPLGTISIDITATSPTTMFPGDGEQQISIAPQLAWQSGDQYSSWRVQVATDSLMQSLVIDQIVDSPHLPLDGLDIDTEYFWRTRIESPQLTGAYSDVQKFTTRSPLNGQLPEQQIIFGNGENPLHTQDYRLIGLPGSKDIPVHELLKGKYGNDWKVFTDNGAADNFLVEYSADNPLSFSEGQGLWVLSKQPLPVGGAIQPVTVSARDTYSMTLQPGWNIITNPFARTVSWPQVQAFNQFQAPLFGYEGGFSEHVELAPLTGYYVHNDSTEAMELEIPYTNLDKRIYNNQKTAEKLKTQSGQITLNINIDGQKQSARVHMVYDNDARRRKSQTHYMPPLELSTFGAAILDEDNAKRKKRLHTIGDVFDRDRKYYTVEVKAHRRTQTVWTPDIAGFKRDIRVLVAEPAKGRSKILGPGDSYRFMAAAGRKQFEVYVGTAAELQKVQERMIPQQATLNQNYPNPFNPTTTIQFGIDQQSDVSLQVFDILGRKVQTLVNKQMKKGWHKVTFDARRLASGTYFYRLKVNQQIQTKKMVLIK